MADDFGVALGDQFQLFAVGVGEGPIAFPTCSTKPLYIDSVVRQSRPQINIDRTFIKQPLELNGDAGDQYTGLDRFGRVSDLNWLNTNTSASVDRYQYTFDRNSNRTRRDNLLNNNFSERYDYDNLGQLTTLERANSIEKSWNYDALGNWESVTQGASTQTRTHNVQNEITSVSGQASPTYDLNGNQTRDFAEQTFTFDAWNRLVKVTPSGGGAPIREYEYDARFRRIEETAGTTTTEFYYSANWQVLEEHVDNTLESEFVWSPTYIDALILRDRNADGNSANGLEERLWVLQDANYNVTALVNSSGVVVERYAYDPFGSVQILDNSWNTRSSSAYSWDYLHQGLRYDAGIDKYHVRFRDYDPQSGRWLSMDPIGFAAGDVNLYRGAGNNLIKYNDPSGLDVILLLKTSSATGNIGAMGHGHAAVLVEVGQDRWKLYSIYPAAGNEGLAIDPDGTESHWKHLGDRYNSLERARLDSDLNEFTYYAHFRTDHASTKAAYKKANELVATKKYSVSYNCLDVADEILKASGVRIDKRTVGDKDSEETKLIRDALVRIDAANQTFSLPVRLIPGFGILASKASSAATSGVIVVGSAAGIGTHKPIENALDMKPNTVINTAYGLHKAFVKSSKGVKYLDNISSPYNTYLYFSANPNPFRKGDWKLANPE